MSRLTSSPLIGSRLTSSRLLGTTSLDLLDGVLLFNGEPLLLNNEQIHINRHTEKNHD